MAEAVAFPEDRREGDDRVTEPGAAQSKADWGASGRLQACSAEQKAEPAGEKGSGGGQPNNQ